MGTKPKVEDWMWKAVNDIADLQDKRLSEAFHIRAEVAVEMMAGIIARHYAPIAEAHAAEVKRLEEIIPPVKLRALADWLDLKHPGPDTEVQQDLRRLAAALEAK